MFCLRIILADTFWAIVDSAVNALGAAICVYVFVLMNTVFGYFLFLLTSEWGDNKSREFSAAPGEDCIEPD